MTFKPFLTIAAALGLACAAVQASPAGAQALGAGNADWQNILTAAKGESLRMMVMTGTPYADMVAAFQKAYPDIKVDMTQARPGDSTTRIVAEQQNGQFYWDIFWGPSNNLNAVLVPADALQDIRPFFVLPEVTDDANWMGGFELYSQDLTKRRLSFLAEMNVGTGRFAVNWDKVPKGSLTDWKDLLDPKWKGKIAIYDPTRPVTGAINLSCALPLVGEDFIRKLFEQQKLTPLGDARLITDWIVRGRYPIVIGLSSSFLPNFQKEGLGMNVADVGGTVCSGAGGPGLAVMKKAPDANATKVFLNWLASKEGQALYAQKFWPFNQTFSRRVDVTPPEGPEAAEAIATLKSGKGITTGSETHEKLMQQVLAISKEYFK
ncbi:MAG TPA: ABC transporter substrate-binding protein [Alphaproteobacteria bacterium]|jgi:iron(III) transport system substrate-binding protein